jgi:phenylpropionate dioxygenase-like ring-hydroxylating dioxygenase large terminal subunit
MLKESDLTVGPMLSDGTAVSSLFNLEKREVSLRLFSDPEVFELEQEHLFARMWNLMGHETEIPDPGDYVTRNIGLDVVIVCRDRDGEIHVMLNTCTHRGMAVCRADIGNAANFKCPYHGWVFNTDGSFLGAPFEKEFYGDILDHSELGLKTARVEMWAGFIFANWDDEAPSFDEFLGPYRYYVDTIFNSTDDGLEIVGVPQRFLIRSNWKAASEQFNGADGYHAATLHRSLFEAQMNAMGVDLSPEMMQGALANVLDGIDISSKEGHGLRALGPGGFDDVKDLGVDELIARLQGGPRAAEAGLAAVPSDMVAQYAKHLTVGQLRMMASNPPAVGGMFPNIGFLGMNIRVHVPRDANHFEMVNWAVVPKGASREVKEAMRKSQLAMFGTSGTVEQDDAESWPSIQRNSRGFWGKQHSMKYQALIGENKPDGWEGGANVHAGLTKDDSGWNFWLRYRDYMLGQAW